MMVDISPIVNGSFNADWVLMGLVSLFGVALVSVVGILVKSYIAKIDQYITTLNAGQKATNDALTELTQDHIILKNNVENNHQMMELRLKNLDIPYDGEKLANIIVAKFAALRDDSREPIKT